MKTNLPPKRGPFAAPLQPLESSQKAGELEELHLDHLPRGSRERRLLDEKKEDRSGFSALPVEGEEEEPLPGGMVLASTEDAGVAEGAPRWQFWKRPKRRDRELAVLKEGCAEMVDIMRSMKDELEVGRAEQVGVKTSLSPLPVAVASLQSLSKTQEKTGEILEELKACVAQSSERENNVAESLVGFNETMASVGRTFIGLEKRSERSIEALDKLSKRIEESDMMYKAMFDRLRESEYEFADQIGRASQRGAFAMVSACGLLGLAILFMTVSLNQRRHAIDFSKLPSPIEVAEAQARATEGEKEEQNAGEKGGTEEGAP